MHSVQSKNKVDIIIYSRVYGVELYPVLQTEPCQSHTESSGVRISTCHTDRGKKKKRKKILCKIIREKTKKINSTSLSIILFLLSCLVDAQGIVTRVPILRRYKNAKTGDAIPFLAIE